MGRATPETWAFCPYCERWFYCEGRLDTPTGHPVCPRCSSEPTATKDRAPTNPVQDSNASVGWERDTDRTNPAGWLSLEE